MTNPFECPTDFCNEVPNVLLNRFDAVEGLVEFVEDIKPYHTKVVEVLVEYVHCDDVNVIIDDRWDWIITIICPGPVPRPPDCYDWCGWGIGPWDGFQTLEPLIDIKRIEHGPLPVPDQNNNDGYVADGFVVDGDLTRFFLNRDLFEIKFSPIPEYNGFYTVLYDAVYDPIEDETIIRTVEPVYDYTFLNPPFTLPIGKLKYMPHTRIPPNTRKADRWQNYPDTFDLPDPITYTSPTAPPFPAVDETWWQVADVNDPQQDEFVIWQYNGTEWRPISCYYIGWDILQCKYVDEWTLDVHFGETFTITSNVPCATILDVDQGTNCIVVDRDWTNVFQPEILGEPIKPNMMFFITNSTGNNGMYTIESISYDAGSDTTTICTKNPIPDPTVDGYLSCIATIHLQDLLEVWDMENRRIAGWDHPYEDNAKPLFLGNIVGVSSFEIEGDHTNVLLVGEILAVKGSTGNDGTYTIQSFSYNVGPDTTTVDVVEPIPDLTADGVAELLRSFDWRPEAFDYSQPTAPGAPVLGDIWWKVDDPNMPVDDGLALDDSVNDKEVFRWNGLEWIDITPLFRGYSFHGFDDLIFDALWETRPYSVTHDFGNINVDVPGQQFEVYGGNFIDHFFPSTKIRGVKVASGDPTEPGYLPTTWIPASFPVLTVDDTGNRFIVRGDQTALFTTNKHLYVMLSDTNTGYFTIFGAVYDGVSDTTAISVAESVTAAGRNLGVIAGAVYNPATFTTHLRPIQPVDPDAEALEYTYIGPIRMTIDKQNVGDDGEVLADLAFQDGLGISERLLSVPDRFSIAFTDIGANCFILEPIMDDEGNYINLSDLFLPGHMFRITGSFDQLNNYPPGGTGWPPVWWTTATHSFVAGTGENIVCPVETIPDDTMPYGEILYEPFIVGSQQQRLVDNTITDELNFIWGQTKDWPIVLTDQGGSFIEVEGDVTGCVLAWDEAQILGSDGNDLLPFNFTIVDTDAPADEFRVTGDATESLFVGIQFDVTGNGGNDGRYTVSGAPTYYPTGPWAGTTQIPVTEDVTVDGLAGGTIDSFDHVYEVTGAVYLVGPNRTRIGLHAPNIPNQPDPGLDGTFRLENIDITNWFQYTLKSATDATEEFVINGDATGDIFINAQFRVFNNGANDGIYTAAAAPVYDAINNCTTVTVVEDIVADEVGGVVESYRDNGIRIALSDSIGVEEFIEVAQGNAQVSGGGSLVGAWDYPNWDVGGFDEELNPLFYLYNNKF